MLSIFTLLFCITLTKAQTVEELAELASDGLCSCVNETYSDIDSDVKRAMARIIKYQMQDNQEGMENYVAKLPTDLTSRIETQAAIMEENDDLFQMCLDDMEAAMGELNFEDEQYEGITEEAFVELMMESMKETTGCKFAYILMELGLQMEAENANNGGSNQVKISQIKDKKATDSNENRSKYEGTGGN